MARYYNDTPYFDTGLEELLAYVEKDHSKLYNRDAEDAHPISSITDLQDTLDAKVDVEEGKGLSTNDLTDELVELINNAVQSEEGKSLTSNDFTDEYLALLKNAVQSEEGKSLTSNDFTDEYVALLESALQDDDIGVKIPPLEDGVIPEEYIPESSYDFIVAYPVDGVDELSQGWLSATVGGDPFTPQKGKLYCLAQDTDNYKANDLFRWASTIYMLISNRDSDMEAISNATIDAIILGE